MHTNLNDKLFKLVFFNDFHVTDHNLMKKDNKTVWPEDEKK